MKAILIENYKDSNMKIEIKKKIMICLLMTVCVSAWADVFKQLESRCGVTYDGIMQRQFIKGLQEFDAVVTSLGDPADGRVVFVSVPGDERTLKLVFERAMFNDLKVNDKVRLNLNGCKVGKEKETESLYVTNLNPFNIVKRVSEE